MKINASWTQVLDHYLQTPEYAELIEFITLEYKHKTIFPSKNEIFKALNTTDFEDISVVILGQDPYHRKGQAHGLAFSVASNTTIPPSLKNILKEINTDLPKGTSIRSGDLTSWAKQGVLLLNSVLTVQEGQPTSHAHKGWEQFTDAIIQKISDRHENIVFLLWGNYAKKKGSVIDRSKHCVLESSHPSPLGAYRGFIGCRHFSQTNNYLQKKSKKPINF